VAAAAAAAAVAAASAGADCFPTTMSIWLPGSKSSTTPTYSSKQLQLHICCSLGRCVQGPLIALTALQLYVCLGRFVKPLHGYGMAGACMLQACPQHIDSLKHRITQVCSVTAGGVLSLLRVEQQQLHLITNLRTLSSCLHVLYMWLPCAGEGLERCTRWAEVF
jgi:hypothetical protein